MKTDDIDGCLAADFDGSLSGLGAETASNTYNMRFLKYFQNIPLGLFTSDITKPSK